MVYGGMKGELDVSWYLSERKDAWEVSIFQDAGPKRSADLAQVHNQFTEPNHIQFLSGFKAQIVMTRIPWSAEHESLLRYHI